MVNKSLIIFCLRCFVLNFITDILQRMLNILILFYVIMLLLVAPLKDQCSGLIPRGTVSLFTDVTSGVDRSLAVFTLITLNTLERRFN